MPNPYPFLLALAALVAHAPAPAPTYSPGYPDLPRKVGDVRGQLTGVQALPGPTVQFRVAKITPIGTDDASWVDQLVVRHAGGKVIWAGPTAPWDAPMVFGGGPGGEDRLEAAGPVVRAGEGQVVVAMSQSDLRIPTHLFLRWTGRTFQVARKAMFVEAPAMSGRFVPTPNAETRSRWIATFDRVLGPGRCEVTLGQMKADAVGTLRVVVEATTDGFRLSR